MTPLPRLATYQHRGMVRLECVPSSAPTIVLLDGWGTGGEAFADLIPCFSGMRIWAAVPPSGQPAWMWPWAAQETRYVESDPAASALERVLGWVQSPIDLVIVAPGRLVTADSIPRLGSLVRPILLAEHRPASEVLAELGKLGGGYLLRGDVPTPRLSLAARPDVKLDVSAGPRDITLPHHEWITPVTTFVEDTWFDASLVAPWYGLSLHLRHTASTRAPSATAEQTRDAPTGSLPATRARDGLDPKDGVVEGSVVFLRGGERVTQPLHRVTELRGPSVDLSLIVESATKVMVSVTRGSVIVRNYRVEYTSPMPVRPREPFFVDGVVTHVEIRSFTPSTRPPIVKGEGKSTIVGAFVISGTPVDFIERDPTRHELWVNGSSLVVRGRVQYSGARARVDTFGDQGRLDLRCLWQLARADTIVGQDKMPIVVGDRTQGYAHNSSVSSRTRLALEFDLAAGTLTIVGEYSVSID